VTEVSSSKQKSIFLKIIESEEKSRFTAKILINNFELQSIDFTIDDLLEKRDNGMYHIELWEGKVKLRINLFINILNNMIKKGKANL